MKTTFINHARNRDYMSGIERDKSRTKSTGEVFTPTNLVQEMIDKLEEQNPTIFTDPTKTYLDPTCGDGQFLSEIIIRKMERGSSYEEALSTTYGADLMLDNCKETIKRLYLNKHIKIITIAGNNIPKTMQRKGLKAIFKLRYPNKTISKYLNIVQADGLEYDYSFNTHT